MAALSRLFALYEEAAAWIKKAGEQQDDFSPEERQRRQDLRKEICDKFTGMEQIDGGSRPRIPRTATLSSLYRACQWAVVGIPVLCSPGLSSRETGRGVTRPRGHNEVPPEPRCHVYPHGEETASDASATRLHRLWRREDTRRPDDCDFSHPRRDG